ncbi:MAG: RelA/SpoT family protein [Bacillota bacterium]
MEVGDCITLDKYIDKLIAINDEYDIEIIKEAYEFGKEAHQGQKRKSGEDFFIHPINVTLILAELKMDEETIISALLHDVVEDTSITEKEIKNKFGERVALLVDGVTKLGTIHYDTKEELQAENLRKMFLAMAEDIRVIMIKLADRLHNMRTLEYMPEHKKKEKARETLEIYAPIAHRLGISKIKWELEDRSFKYLYPDKYRKLVDKVNFKRSEREEIINRNINFLKEKVKDQVTDDFTIYGRAKHFYSIYKKMVNKNKKFEEIFDLTAIRILVKDVKECYAILGLCHTIWKPIPGRFKDYIAMPKANMYQSLHTTVITNDGKTLEIQIRTEEMHRVAEYGIAAHWIYKGKKGVSQKDIEKRLAWIKRIMEWQDDLSDPTQFMDSIKVDLYENEVFVFTPDGDVFELPSGSTPLDFAYKVHTEVGHQCVGAKVNGKIVPLSYELSTGEIVSILTKKQSGPSRDWLNIVKSNTAKNKIKRWFKKERRQENIEKGKTMFDRAIKRSEVSFKNALKDKWINPILKKLSLDSIEDLYEALGYGGILLKQVVPKIKEAKRKEEKDKKSKKESSNGKIDKRRKVNEGVYVEGFDEIVTRFAKCCNPLPGDDIIGYVTTGRGVTIHRTDCPNMKDLKNNQERFINVYWKNSHENIFEARIKIIGRDRKGLLSEITILINEENFIVNGLNARKDNKKRAIIELTVEIDNIKHLNKLIEKIKKVKGVIEADRIIN